MEVWSSLVYGNSLENCRTEMFREFESHRFRQNYRELGEWLNQQFAKLSLRKRCMSSNLILSAKNVVDRKCLECYTLFID